jgi:hypothetical protein
MEAIMPETKSLVFYISKYSPKESKKRIEDLLDLYIVDISKIIKDLGYDTKDLSVQSEFILNYSIHKKINHGIYNSKCEGILICYRGNSPDFMDNLVSFVEELQEPIEYSFNFIN